MHWCGAISLRGWRVHGGKAGRTNWQGRLRNSRARRLAACEWRNGGTSASFRATLKTAPIHDVLRILRTARRRLAIQAFLTALGKCALLAAGLLVMLGAVNRWLLGRLPFDPQFTLVAVAAVPVVALLAALAQRKALPQVAVLLDRAGGTRDRFATTLAFAQVESAAEMQVMAVNECSAFARRGDFSRLVRLRLPREAAWLLVPVVALAALQWEAQTAAHAPLAETSAAQAEVEETAKKLEELARQTAKANEEAKTEELKKLAEQLQRSAEQLRANATNPEDAAKSALRELSALEQLVQELQKSPGASLEELQEMAKALAENESTKAAAKALDAGELAKAAEELEKAMQQLAETKDERSEQQIQQALEQALKKLAEKKQLSEAMQKLAQQMQRGQAEKGGLSNEAMKQLAQMLKQMPQGQPSQQRQGGQQQKAATLQQMLAALQNMRHGEADGKPGGEPKPGEAKTPGLVTMQSFAPGNQNGEASPGDPQQPSGQPGSERDTGTTDTPFGKEHNDPGKDAQAKQLAGRLGEGESLSQMLPSAGDASKSNRRYKELYEAMAPAAEDAAQQENIPLGSRFLIKRYFESIRPKE